MLGKFSWIYLRVSTEQMYSFRDLMLLKSAQLFLKRSTGKNSGSQIVKWVRLLSHLSSILLILGQFFSVWRSRKLWNFLMVPLSSRDLQLISVTEEFTSRLSTFFRSAKGTSNFSASLLTKYWFMPQEIIDKNSCTTVLAEIIISKIYFKLVLKLLWDLMTRTEKLQLSIRHFNVESAVFGNCLDGQNNQCWGKACFDACSSNFTNLLLIYQQLTGKCEKRKHIMRITHRHQWRIYKGDWG